MHTNFGRRRRPQALVLQDCEEAIPRSALRKTFTELESPICEKHRRNESLANNAKAPPPLVLSIAISGSSYSSRNSIRLRNNLSDCKTDDNWRICGCRDCGRLRSPIRKSLLLPRKAAEERCSILRSRRQVSCSRLHPQRTREQQRFRKLDTSKMYSENKTGRNSFAVR